MTSLLGSKRWIMAAAAAGTLIAVSGCAPSGTDGGTAAPASTAGSASADAAPSASPSASPSAEVSASPSADATSEAPSSAPSASASASPTAEAPTTPPSEAVSGGTCTAAQLTGSVADQLGGGAAGSVYRTLVLTNASDQGCTLDGFPGVSFVDAAGAQIGAPADRDGSASTLVSLAPGASTTTTLRQTNAQNYGVDCGLITAAGLRVYPPGATDSLVLPQQIPACSAASVVLLTVGTLQPAS
ncbi:DUF4232 domain-containing protein [Arthrobacter sp. Soc17.1.1.1]|uniref:DUF4232 domain-containing protein n=1 Tax=Arthrobacter sp. Soc17.1.1.1 TaxID=3121277 RepID=UPI002FE4F8DD